jgi:acetyl esterase/lipase
MAGDAGQETAVRTISYGSLAGQVGDLHLPDATYPSVVCLLHGGFWRMPYGRDEMMPIAQGLVARGFAVWNLEYRRLGAPGGGWPGTFQDVAAGIDHLATLAGDGVAIDLDRVAVVGHSAGGHLALWCAQRNATRSNGHAPKRVRIAAAIGLAPITDLAHGYELACGNNAVADLLGGSPDEQPERYRTSSPIAMLPIGVKQLIMHGSADDILPAGMSRDYARAAITKGDDVCFVELDDLGHMEFLDPANESHTILCDWLAAV